MIEPLRAWTAGNRDPVDAYLRRCFALGRSLLLQSDLCAVLDAQSAESALPLAGTPLERAVRNFQEGVLQHPWAYFALREGAGRWRYLRMHQEQLVPEAVTVSEFLCFKEQLVRPGVEDEHVLEIDFEPFGRHVPRLQETRSIGQGVLHLNRHLASAMFVRPETGHARLLNFLRLHTLDGQQLMLAPHLADVPALRDALRDALALLEGLDADTPWPDFAAQLGALGFEPGWGDCAGRAAETIGLLVDILEAPSPGALEAFLARVSSAAPTPAARWSTSSTRCARWSARCARAWRRRGSRSSRGSWSSAASFPRPTAPPATSRWSGSTAPATR